MPPFYGLQWWIICSKGTRSWSESYQSQSLTVVVRLIWKGCSFECMQFYFYSFALTFVALWRTLHIVQSQCDIFLSFEFSIKCNFLLTALALMNNADEKVHHIHSVDWKQDFTSSNSHHKSLFQVISSILVFFFNILLKSAFQNTYTNIFLVLTYMFIFLFLTFSQNNTTCYLDKV